MDLSNISGFDWDDYNIIKSWEKHSVHFTECEEIFFNLPLVVKNDELHSDAESRYFCLGRTDSDRLVFLVFTLRNNLIRVISARDMNKRERKIYEKYTKIQE